MFVCVREESHGSVLGLLRLGCLCAFLVVFVFFLLDSWFHVGFMVSYWIHGFILLSCIHIAFMVSYCLHAFNTASGNAVNRNGEFFPIHIFVLV